MPKRCLLFVDNDVRLLDTMRDMLQPMQAEWDLLFCNNVATALGWVEERAVDIVVADGRLALLEGRHLLHYVRALSPHTVRFVLAAETDKNALADTLALGHQFLARPCQSQQLIQAIQRTSLICTVTGNPVLQQIVTNIGVLPMLPSAQAEIMRVVQSSTVSMKQVSAVIAQDLAISVEVLRLVNSAYFNLRQQVTDLQQAVILLGLDTVRALVQAVTVFSVLESEKTRNLRQDLYGHMLDVSQRARLMIRHLSTDRTTIDNAILAGMVHDIGKLIFCTYFAQDYFPTMALARSAKMSLHQAERQIFGVSHAELGAYLLGLWGFNEEIIIAVGFHHEPGVYGNADCHALTVLHAANYMHHQERTPAVVHPLDRDYLAKTDHGQRLVPAQAGYAAV